MVVRVLFGLVVAASLLAGIVGGLVRAGWPLPIEASAWLTQAVVAHAFLMVCGFLGTVIGIERAVAVKRAWSFAAPAASGGAGVLALAGHSAAAAALAVFAAAVFVLVNVIVVARQRASHTGLLLMAALVWLAANLGHALDLLRAAVVPLWLAFLVLTIAAERLEMARLMRRSARAGVALYAALAVMLGGAILSSVSGWGGVTYGAGLFGLALWLLTFDIARRTVVARGLSRYMAICLLLGHGWLALSGLAWAATSLGLPWRDAALHALALGFVFSMIFGHAPVILPAVARVKLHFSAAFYAPLALLHVSLAWRLFLAPLAPDYARTGSAINAAAIGLFVLTVAGSALAWRIKYSSIDRPHHEHPVRH
ncbi:hypothetical protein HLB44_28915 [Aquincola sp. S2]|uniref:NnrS family protein n=1 Tax=Pseudaquabacterium terrae TaxID=2732868 RepID=A0ABX2EQX3_9BURK|nr:hypothetical protein [Aquabacterium terrae]NRF71031.1 hypothetical protein [Aquabacterium terrae]